MCRMHEGTMFRRNVSGHFLDTSFLMELRILCAILDYDDALSEKNVHRLALGCTGRLYFCLSDLINLGRSRVCVLLDLYSTKTTSDTWDWCTAHLPCLADVE